MSGLMVLRHGGDRERPLVVHQPRHQVGAVAAEIEQRPAAVLHRVGEPVEELRLDVDLLRALVAVHRHHLADLAAGLLLLQQRPDRAVARIPGRLVVDDDVDAAALAARSIRRACSMLTASGFSIITWMWRGAAASTTAGWSQVLVKAATASGFVRSSMVPRSVKKIAPVEA